MDEKTSGSSCRFHLRSSRTHQSFCRQEQSHHARDLEKTRARLGLSASPRDLYPVGTMVRAGFSCSGNQNRPLVEVRAQVHVSTPHVLRRKRRGTLLRLLPSGQEEEGGSFESHRGEVSGFSPQGGIHFTFGTRRLRHGFSTLQRHPRDLPCKNGGELLLDRFHGRSSLDQHASKSLQGFRLTQSWRNPEPHRAKTMVPCAWKREPC